MSENMKFWEKLNKPPATALKQIQAGRLKGMSDINPQWRYKVMTETFGICGTGWKFEIVSKTEKQCGEEISVFVDINLFIKVDGEWSEPIPGTGGSTLYASERNGMHMSDEAYKMALTDALSVAMKMLGVASSIYEGMWDGSKYKEEQKQKAKTPNIDSLFAKVAKEQAKLPEPFKAEIRLFKDNAVDITPEKLQEYEAAIVLHIENFDQNNK